MVSAISNTSPFLYLYRIGALNWLPQLFDKIWVPDAVVAELEDGIQRGYNAPHPRNYQWVQIVNPNSMPSEWLTLDLGGGELAAMALALENPKHIVILDDLLARRTAQAAQLSVWGTLRVLLEAKQQNLTQTVAPHLDQLQKSGMWVSDSLKDRILKLAGEK